LINSRLINAHGAVYLGHNVLSDFFSRSSEKLRYFNQLDKGVIPADAVFLYDVLNMFIFTAKCFDFDVQGYFLLERYV